MSGLGKQLQKMVNSYSGTWSVYVKDLEKGGEICINDRAMYPASTIKAFVMASTFDQIKKGKLSYNSVMYVKDLEKGGEICINDRAMYPASTIKAFVMASTFDQIKKGKLSYNSVKGLLNSMITVSDNEAYNQLVRCNSPSRSFVSGAGTVNKYLKRNGYKKTGCHSATALPEALSAERVQ